MQLSLAVKCLLAAIPIAIGAIFPAQATGDWVPALWGIDEDDGQLFSFGDYRDPLATFTDYGALQYWNNGELVSVGRHIEAFTISPGGIAYMAVNSDIAGFDEAVLLSFDLDGASTSGPNIVDFVGRIGVDFDDKGDNVTGLSFDPISGNLFMLFRDNGHSTVDRLMIIDELTGDLISDLGQIGGLGETSDAGEDLVFDPFGNLYVTDDHDDHLYRIDRLSGEILAILDDYEAGGLGENSLKLEALAWDFVNNQLIGMDDKHELLVQFSSGSGNNTVLADVGALGLTDVEGMAFIPEPSTSAVIVAGMLMFVGWRIRFHDETARTAKPLLRTAPISRRNRSRPTRRT